MAREFKGAGTEAVVRSLRRGDRPLRLRQAVVASVNGGVANIRLADDDTPVPARALGWYQPVVGDSVWVLENQPDLLIIGRLDEMNGGTFTGAVTLSSSRPIEFLHPTDALMLGSFFVTPTGNRRFFQLNAHRDNGDTSSRILLYSPEDTASWAGNIVLQPDGGVALVNGHLTVSEHTTLKGNGTFDGNNFIFESGSSLRWTAGTAQAQIFTDGGSERLVIGYFGGSGYSSWDIQIGRNAFQNVHVTADLNVAGSKNAVIADPEDETKQFKFAATESNTPGFMEVDLGVVTIPQNRRLTLRPEYLHKYSLIGRDPRVRMFSAGPREDAAPNAPYGWVEWSGADPKVELRAPAGEYFVELRFIRNDPGVEGWEHYGEKPPELEEPEEPVEGE